jgi:hypothetical protein
MMHVTITRAELLASLAYFEDMSIERLAAEAQVYATGVGMVIDCAGNSVQLAARGQWQRVARVPASLFIGLAKRPPSGDEIVMRVEGERFFLGSTSAECVLQDEPETRIIMPLDPSLAALFRTNFHYPQDVIDQAGLLRAVDAAVEQSLTLIRDAADVLAPLGISAPVLRDLVVAHLKDEA